VNRMQADCKLARNRYDVLLIKFIFRRSHLYQIISRMVLGDERENLPMFVHFHLDNIHRPTTVGSE
jgi:hypothetical protein